MVITIITTKDKEKWVAYLEEVECKDIFFDCEYFRLNEQESGYIGEMFIYENEGNLVVYPYLKIPLHTLSFFSNASEDGEYYDITSLEYGGALMKNKNVDFFSSFLQEFNSYCRANNIITEFLRLHPLMPNEYQLGKEKIKETFCIDLHQSEDDIFSHYGKSNRNAINRSLREKIEIVHSKEKKYVDAFYTIYMKTMKRRHARSFYLYTREYLDRLIESFGNGIELFVAYFNGVPVSTGIFLCGGETVHYYLAGSKPEFGKYGGSNLLLHTAILWAKKQGFSQFNLGSGYQPKDNLLKFKSSFTNTSVPYWRYRRIHSPELYIKFIEAKEAYSKQNDFFLDDQFFPKYRG